MATDTHAAHDAHGSHSARNPRLAELEQMVGDGRIDTLVVAITDMQGRLMGKRVQGQAFLDGVIDHGAHFCTYLLGTDMEMNTPEGFALMNWETGYGDWIAEPVWDTLRVLPWLEKTAIVLGDTSTRRSTRRSRSRRGRSSSARSRRHAAMGLSVKAGSEFEYYVLKETWERVGAAGLDVPQRFGYYNEDYHLLQATKAEPLHRLLRNQMTEARIPIEFSKGEAAPGQHEVNIRYDHVLESADRSVLFKHGAKEIAYLNGWGITFMAKPDHTWTGSSGHLHMSVWDDDGRQSLTHDPAAKRPYGMSDTMAPLHGRDDATQPRAGDLHRAEHQLLQALRRRCRGRRSTSSGAATTGRPASGSSATATDLHVENRFPGGDMNAYLTYAAMVGAGLWGIEHELEPPDEFKGNGYIATGVPRMPRALYEAIHELEASEAAVEIFGADVVAHYLNAARVEQETYDSIVHHWDRERYLERA